ncbi:MAG: hypothetical protein HOH19_05460 [Kordiimonadaceae bacterium]|nr:hypothetical protein [Kordiimonadaceae bacterium]MBT6032002.1 hypothetical protein [Kordiimonadaceae bacterium]
MTKFTTLLTASVFTAGLMITNAYAFQAAPQASDQAKASMEKVAAKAEQKSMDKAEKMMDKDAKMMAKDKKMEGYAKAEAAKMKKKVDN